MLVDQRVEERTKAWQDEDVEWRASVVDGIKHRYKIQLMIPFLLALLAASVSLLGAKLFPWFNR